MSVMEKIFGAFQGGNKPLTATNPGTQPNPTNNLNTNLPPIPPKQGEGTAPNGVIPGDDQIKSPLETHANLWEHPVPDPKDKTPEQPSPEDVQTRMLEAAGKVDFSKVATQEELAKIAAGGQEAVQALVGLLNKTAQTVYGQSTVVAHKLIEKAVNDAKTEFASQVPGLVKRQASRESLLTENPAFKNPAVLPVVAAVQSQLAEKYPKATSDELNKMAKEILGGFAEVFNPPKSNPGADKKAKDEDWDLYLQGSDASS